MIAYFDCYAGVAGDMILGAMIDAGLPFNYLKRQLNSLPLGGYEISKKIERRGAVGGVNLQVIPLPFVRGGSGRGRYLACRQAGLPTRQAGLPTRQAGLPPSKGGSVHYKDIIRLISKSRLNKNIRQLTCAIFETLARAEARVHRTSVDDVHFHEVGAVDSIVDIVGAAIGFDHFGFDAIYASPLPVIVPPYPNLSKKGEKGGLGRPAYSAGRPAYSAGRRNFIKCSHGRIPIPAPAVLEILKGAPVAPSPVLDEIVTPTGAAVLKTVVKRFGDNPVRRLVTVGYGLGDKHFRELPNSLRLLIGWETSEKVIASRLQAARQSPVNN